MGAAGGARLPQLRRQALLHPVGIDDAGAAQGRPAGGQQISLRLVVGEPELPRPAALAGAAARQDAGTRRHRHRHSARQQRGLYQAGDRPARRHDRGAGRTPGPQWPNGALAAARSGADPGRCQRPLRARIFRITGPRRRRQGLLPAADRSRNFAQRRQLRHHRSRPKPGRRLRPGHGAGRPRLPDGRQSRSQRRQPFPRRAARKRPRRPGAVGEYRRPCRVHHFLARRNDELFNPVSWFEALRGGRAGSSLRPQAEQKPE